MDDTFKHWLKLVLQARVDRLWKQREHNSYLTTTEEDLLSNRLNEVQQLANHMGITLKTDEPFTAETQYP